MDNIQHALSALNFLDSGCSYEEWIQIGMAAKAAGLSFEDFHSWCENGSNYKNRKDCLTAWNSFKETGGITAATLFYLARQKGWQPPKEDKYYSNINVSKKVNKNHYSENHNKDLKLNVIDIWDRCLPASPTHPYILKKQGNTAGLRYYPSTEQQLKILDQNISEYLVLPCWSANEIQTLQFIPTNGGKKLNLPGRSFNDGYFVVGNIQDILYVCEGIGQAWAVNKASGQAAIVCFGAGRMRKIATLLREKYPNASSIIIPDRGKEKLACDIATIISARWIELPKDKPANYDVNDYALEYGYEKLAFLLEHLKTPEMHYKLLSGTELLNAPPMRWIVQSVLPAEGLAALYGASGSGKSFLILIWHLLLLMVKNIGSVTRLLKNL